ncbi:MAG: hypothetical protein MZU95_00190 [Desulfomicrobium escambiense]|nr:hypothetical protein [Desulfomicrobium escambiense]
MFQRLGGILQQEIRLPVDGKRTDVLGAGGIRKPRAAAGHPQKIAAPDLIAGAIINPAIQYDNS